MMRLFRKRKRKDEDEQLRRLPHRDVGAAIEIIAHKEATREAAEKARAATAQLQELLDENGFTIKIFLAAGGRHHNHGTTDK